MSFKRDGDDVALLRNLKMRRVGELLGDHIPDDEATLLSNGRLCCTICSHRPIFDTTATLAVHRKGKKHLLELSKFLSHKRELELKQVKADHFKCVQAEQRLSQPNNTSGSSRLYSRKPVLDVPSLKVDEHKHPTTPSAQSQVRHYLKSIWKKRALDKTVEKLRENYGETAGPVKTETDLKPESVKEIQIQSEKPTATTGSSEWDESKKKAAEYHLQMKMSGWIKDADGNWIKDPEVEFDSDDEEPALPTPPPT